MDVRSGGADHGPCPARIGCMVWSVGRTANLAERATRHLDAGCGLTSRRDAIAMQRHARGSARAGWRSPPKVCVRGGGGVRA